MIGWRRSRIVAVGVALALVLGLVARHVHTAGRRVASKQMFPGTVSIGIVTWPGYLPLIVAKRAG